MSVYVDELRDYPHVRGRTARCGTRWSHMTADTLNELHAMADRIGLRREWFQAAPRLHMCHYDLTPSRRAAAVRLGATEVNARQHMRALIQDGRDRLLAEDV